MSEQKKTSKNDELIKTTALRTLEIEAKAVADLRGSINDDFCAVVEAIAKTTGRVVVTGIGKSALVAQKIVATLNSTGTAALFMHAADAIHGDLGMIQPNDVVICLSKSGETPEIKALIPPLRHRGNLLVGMVSQLYSTLGKQSDLVLHTPIEQEADPNNLAPTASTTAQMVMGDALATALLAYKGFSSEDFARVHPGGALGKQLYLRVSDLLLLHEKPAVGADQSIRQTIVEITSKRLGATAVLDDEQKVIGIVTDGDLRRMLNKSENFSTLVAKNIMSAYPKTIAASALAVEALAKMQTLNISQLIVIDDKNSYQGMIHIHDLIREGLI